MPPTLTDADLRERLDDIDQLVTIAMLGKQSLVRQGQPIYAPPEHERRELAFDAEFDAAIAEHEQAAEAAVLVARDQLSLIEDADPRGFRRFTHEDMALVNSAWLPIAERDVAHLPIGDLETLCRGVLAQGDKHTVAAYTAAMWWHVAGMPQGMERGRMELLLSEFTDRMADPKRDEKTKAAQRQFDLVMDLRRKISAASERVHMRERLAAAARAGGPLG